MSAGLERCLKPDNVIIVDSDGVDRKFYSFVFEPFGNDIEVYAADTGTQGLEFLRVLAKEKSADQKTLVVTDLDLPDMGGLAFIKQIRAEAAGKTVPLVVSTNVTNALRLYQARENGADLVCSKDEFFRNFDVVFARICAFMSGAAALPMDAKPIDILGDRKISSTLV